MTLASHVLFAERLRAARSIDGFGPRKGAAPEPEPTALASLALDDDAGRGWLETHQREDGSFALLAGPVVNDQPTGLCALALPPGTGRERALDHIVTTRARTLAATPDIPHDPTVHGWAWTVGTYGWVEPTSHALLALRALRPTATAQIEDGLAMLADRECLDGGWNYGNPFVLGVALEPYAQTTAMALVALQGVDPELSRRGTAALRVLWPREPGGLSLAVTLAAFRMSEDPDSAEVESALVAEFRRTGFLGDVVALAWAALATGPGLASLRRAG